MMQLLLRAGSVLALALLASCATTHSSNNDPREWSYSPTVEARKFYDSGLGVEDYLRGKPTAGGQALNVYFLCNGFIEAGEAWLDAVHIPEYTGGSWTNHPPRRKRKLLLHKAQILKIQGKVKEGGYTIIPLSLYFSDGRAKVELAVAKGKREYDKRQALRERQDNREAARAISSRKNLGD